LLTESHKESELDEGDGDEKEEDHDFSWGGLAVWEDGCVGEAWFLLAADGRR